MKRRSFLGISLGATTLTKIDTKAEPKPVAPLEQEPFVVGNAAARCATFFYRLLPYVPPKKGDENRYAAVVMTDKPNDVPDPENFIRERLGPGKYKVLTLDAQHRYPYEPVVTMTVEVR